MGTWSKSAISEITEMQLRDIFDSTKSFVAPESLIESFYGIHEQCVKRGAAPRDLIALIAAFKGILQTKSGGSFKEVDRLKAGLKKLEEAQSTVDELSQSAGVQRAQLKIKQTAADEAMTSITEALALASDRKKEVEVLQKTLAVAEHETRARKAAVEEQLEGVMPLVEQAKAAVGSIRKENLDEIRSLKMPPEAIADVLSAVLLLLGINDTSWVSMKKFLGSRGVKEDILGFDAHRITPKIRAAVMKLLREKGESFERENITRASVAAAPLAIWVTANLQYSDTLEKIAPLEQDLQDASSSLERSQQELDQNKRELEELDARVKQLKDDFARRTAEAETLRQALARTEDTLNRAQSLLSQLAGERDRWSGQVGELHRAQSMLPMHALLAAGFITYLGKCSEDVRQDAVHSWRQLVSSMLSRASAKSKLHSDTAQAFASAKFDVQRILSSESDTLVWKSQGLPADNLSIENVIIILNSQQGKRTPFIIDPSTRATQWLQKHLEEDKSSPLEVVSAGDARFQNQVELGIRFGKSLLIKECDKVEPLLYSVLRKDLIHQGPRSVVRLGDKFVDVNENFRLFMATRNPKPILPPDAASLINEINFTVTRSGLESQLLGVTLQHEQPALEAKKSQLLQQEEQLKIQLIGVEDSLLAALAQSSGNLLDNVALLDSLAKAKSKSTEISSSLEGSEVATRELDAQRQGYQPFANAGARLFFCIQALQATNHMYQYSLASFLRLFSSSLKETAPSPTLAGRISCLCHDLEVRTLMHIGKSLLKDDRLTFALHLVHSMHPEIFVVSTTGSGDAGWSYFVGDVVTDNDDSVSPVPVPLWASKDRVPAFKAFNVTFPDLCRSLGFNDAQRWGRWAQSPCPEREFPASLSSLSSFERLLVLQTLRPDRLLSGMQQLVMDALQLQSINPPPVSVHTLFEASEATDPILMITTPGADPTRELSEYAACTVGKQRYIELAMGGGVQQEALAVLRKAAEEGHWLCLKNLHLVSSWLPTLEKEFMATAAHPQFRLWMTTECHRSFAPILLQSSLKATFEAPPGIKKNIQRTYESWGPEFVESGSLIRSQLLFLLAWLNAVVQERRIFVPQGWTKSYEFSYADLRAGASVIDSQLSRFADKVPWAYLHGLIENTVYGGRIDNPSDLRILRAYLATVLHPDVIAARNGRVVARGSPCPPLQRMHHIWR
jgi:dynein heavy chain 2